jgi:hypothetical protein
MWTVAVETRVLRGKGTVGGRKTQQENWKRQPVYVYRNVGKVNMELQLDATITVLLISKIRSICFGQTFAHLQERKT